MQAGRYDRKITIEAYTETTGAYGNVIEGWGIIHEAWAHKREASAREVFQAEKTTNYNTAIYTMRYWKQTDAKMRVVDNGRIYDVHGVQEIGRRKELQLTTEWDGNQEFYEPSPLDGIADGTVY